MHFFNSRGLATRAVILVPEGVKHWPSNSLAAASASALLGYAQNPYPLVAPVLELVGTLDHNEVVFDVAVIKVDNCLSSYASGMPPMMRMDGVAVVVVEEEDIFLVLVFNRRSSDSVKG